MRIKIFFLTFSSWCISFCFNNFANSTYFESQKLRQFREKKWGFFWLYLNPLCRITVPLWDVLSLIGKVWFFAFCWFELVDSKLASALDCDVQCRYWYICLLKIAMRMDVWCWVPTIKFGLNWLFFESAMLDLISLDEEM